MTDVGMNLAPVQYYGTEFPFIDRMKTSGGWGAYGLPISLDAQGNPTAIPTGVNLVQTLVALDPVSAPMTDVYELTWSGTATFQVPGTTVISSQPGKLVFQYTNTTTTMANIVIRSISATDPVHDIHLVREDQVADFQHGEIFNSDFLAQASNWQTLRFMDWENINNTTITSWDQRAHLDDASWSISGNSSGVPIEAMIQLANEAHTDMWFNVPTQADDDYVRNALELIKANLAPGLKVHVEYSNEVWNTSFQQSKYAQTMANQLWGKDANHDGVINPNDPAEAVTSGNNVYYGYRSAQIAAIANSVFSGADDDRLEMVFATQNGNNTLEKYLFDGIAKANVGSVSSLFDEWSVTSYFGLEMGGATAADRATILGWANSGDAGLTAAFQELAHGGAGLSVKYSIDDVAKYLVYEKSVADRYGLDLVGYEGGFHGSAVYFGADQATVMDFFARLMADPRMEDLYKYWFDTFENAGGKMVAAYYDVAAPSNFGTFGTLASLYDPKTPRYDALLSEAAPKVPVLTTDDTGTQGLKATSTIAAHLHNDFNGDGRSDILWRSDSGELSDWLANANGGFTDNAANSFTSVSTNWHVAGTGDFNGDGRSDILWRSDSGELSDWLANANGGFADNAANSFTSVSTNWHVVGTGDFNGDGRSDILWRSDSGELSDWLANANGGFTDNAANSFTSVPTNWHVVGTGDFNGDGRSDILWRSDSGELSDWLANANGGFANNDADAYTQVATNWQVQPVHDFIV